MPDKTQSDYCEPYETVFPGLFQYRVIEFHYKYDINELEETYIDLTFEKKGELVKLRFYSPVQIKFNGSFHPQQGGGFEIRNVKKCQLENIGVQVSSFESMEGNFEFFARAVAKLR